MFVRGIVSFSRKIVATGAGGFCQAAFTSSADSPARKKTERWGRGSGRPMERMCGEEKFDPPTGPRIGRTMGFAPGAPGEARIHRAWIGGSGAGRSRHSARETPVLRRGAVHFGGKEKSAAAREGRRTLESKKTQGSAVSGNAGDEASTESTIVRLTTIRRDWSEKSQTDNWDVKPYPSWAREGSCPKNRIHFRCAGNGPRSRRRPLLNERTQRPRRVRMAYGIMLCSAGERTNGKKDVQQAARPDGPGPGAASLMSSG